MSNVGIIRNRLKIHATIANAKAYLKVVKKYGSLDKFLWSYVDYKPIAINRETLPTCPQSTPLSDRASKDLKKLGFKNAGEASIFNS